MYFELSHHKLAALCAIGIGFAIGIAVFLFANGSWAVVNRSAEAIALAESNAAYWLHYKRVPDATVYAAGPDLPPGDAVSIPVLLYHGEGATSNMPERVFVDQMRALKAAGWTTITMEQYDAWVQGNIELPQKSFVLTFDDGRKDTYYQSDPVLRDFGFNAVMFVITGFSLPPGGKQSNFYLNKTELADMAASGRWELESHGNEDHALYAVQSTTDLSVAASTTQGHFLSNKFWVPDENRFETDAEFAARITKDMETSKQILENDFGREVIAYAYPFNDFGEDTVNFPGSTAIVDAIEPHVYRYTFYQTWPENGDTFNYPETNNGPGTSEYMEKRIEPSPEWSGQDLLDVLNAGSAKSLPYRATSFGDEWVQAWGSATSTSDGLLLSALPNTSGADAYLNGSGWWRDYAFFATIDWRETKTTDITLIVRNTNDQHYLSCSFSPTGAVIERHDKSVVTQIARANGRLATSSLSTLGAQVSGDTITCYENNMPLVTASVNGIAPRGGIGIEIWQKNLGSAHMVVRSVSVREAR